MNRCVRIDCVARQLDYLLEYKTGGAIRKEILKYKGELVKHGSK